MYLDSYTIGKDSFIAIHNTLCNLQWHKDDTVKDAVEAIRRSLKDLYDQENAAFTARSKVYSRVKEELGLSTIWSIYEVEDMDAEHPYQGATTVVYKDHWGEIPVVSMIDGNTWAALYAAADACIRDSGDSHHTFIEGFNRCENALYLTTGS